MKILIISDAWHPQINGVVRTLEATLRELQKMGHDAQVVGPDIDRLSSVVLPFFPDVTLEFFTHKRLRSVFDQFQPDIVHIATEGLLGWEARRVCLQRGWPFTTAYHTRFPEYLAARAPLGVKRGIHRLSDAVLRRFHAPSHAVMVPTPSMEEELKRWGVAHLARWSRGVDTDVFQAYGKVLDAYASLPRPILLYVGRVAAEKNLPDFLSLDTKGSKVVIGDGPETANLRARFPDAHFLGAINDNDLLARHYAAADLFVFPSTTDTFGLVLVEAAAAGLRIASKPAPGPVDIFADPSTRRFAVLNEDLQMAVMQALELPDNPDVPRAFAKRFSWKACTEAFLKHHEGAVIRKKK